MNYQKNKICKTLSVWTVGVLLAIMGSSVSCDFLSIEKYVDRDLAIDSIFTNRRNLEAFMWGATNYLPDEGAIFGGSGMYTPGPMATDEAFCLFGTTTEFHGMAFVLGQWNETNLGVLNRWQQFYQVVRLCNTVITRMNECVDCRPTDFSRILAHTRFLRAYAYYLLLMNHGPVVLLGDEVLANNEDIAYYDRPRDLYDDCVEYICTELEEAAIGLPLSVTIMEFGKPTKGVALALVARLRLQHASDLYNGGSSAHMYFGAWTRKTDGKHYIQQKADPKRWAIAAAAAKRVIDLKDANGGPAYSLHHVRLSEELISEIEDADKKTYRGLRLSKNTDDPNYLKRFPEGAAGICPYMSYAYMFNGETVSSVNKEFIWARNSSQVTNYTRHSFPVANGGWNGMCITQKIIDAYEMGDGHSISNSSSDFPYIEDPREFTSERLEIYPDYFLQASVNRMYEFREPRFYASVGFSGCFWPNRSTTTAAQKDLTITYYANSPNGKFGPSNPDDHPMTGYVVKKYVNPIDAWAGDNSMRIQKAFPMIRYAEMLLAYAEALNQLDNSYTINVDGTGQLFDRNTAEIKWAYNLVRYRAGLPGLTDTDLGNPELVLEKIKRERMVEFLYENHRYFDVRRWGDYDVSESESIMGMNTSGNIDTYFQRVVLPSSRVAQRIVDRKMIFLPIPKVEMKRLPSFDQNPGW